MPISLSDYLEVKKSIFVSKRIFDTILDSDSLYFINFLRIKDTKIPELLKSYEKIQKFFREIGILLKASISNNDRFYREAYNRLNMSELQEICLGYSLKGTAGSGSGSHLKKVILSTAKEILNAGIEDSEIFQLVGLFEENIGPDRISDAIGRIIRTDLERYSRRILKELTKGKHLHRKKIKDGLLINPYNKKTLIFVNGFFKMYQNWELKMYHLNQFLQVGVLPPFPIYPEAGNCCP
jgi:hypothetical protein